MKKIFFSLSVLIILSVSILNLKSQMGSGVTLLPDGNYAIAPINMITPVHADRLVELAKTSPEGWFGFTSCKTQSVLNQCNTTNLIHDKAGKSAAYIMMPQDAVALQEINAIMNSYL